LKVHYRAAIIFSLSLSLFFLSPSFPCPPPLLSFFPPFSFSISLPPPSPGVHACARARARAHTHTHTHEVARQMLSRDTARPRNPPRPPSHAPPSSPHPSRPAAGEPELSKISARSRARAPLVTDCFPRWRNIRALTSGRCISATSFTEERERVVITRNFGSATRNLAEPSLG